MHDLNCSGNACIATRLRHVPTGQATDLCEIGPNTPLKKQFFPRDLPLPAQVRYPPGLPCHTTAQRC
jgi:hypothetical protein